MAALLDRPDSEKGLKDAGELLRLLKRGVDPKTACDILTAATTGPLERIPDYVDTVLRFIAEKSGANSARIRRSTRGQQRCDDR